MNHNRRSFSISPTLEDYRGESDHLTRVEGGLRVNGKFQRKSEVGKPLVSIITIVRNSEATLERTIHSVLNQTYGNIEYIIIDGGSTDNTLDIIRKYEENIAYWTSKPDKGISDAFNKGISESTGEVVGTINADDWYCDNAVESIIEEYSHHGSCIFHGKCQYWGKDNKPYYIFSGRDDILHTMTINHPTTFVPRKFYEEVGLFNLGFRVSMDYEWIRRAKLQKKEFRYIDKTISNMSLGGMSDQLWGTFYLEEFRIRSIYGMNLAANYFIFFNMLGVSLLRKFLEGIGLKNVVQLYRKHFSITLKDAVDE